MDVLAQPSFPYRIARKPVLQDSTGHAKDWKCYVMKSKPSTRVRGADITVSENDPVEAETGEVPVFERGECRAKKHAYDRASPLGQCSCPKCAAFLARQQPINSRLTLHS